MNIIAVILICFFVLVLLGFPIAFSMGISGAITIVTVAQNIPLMVIPQRVFAAMDATALMAIPFFILAGELMNGGGITRSIIRFSNSLIGHIRGGLAHVNVLASMMFAGLSGSAAADASSIGAMLIPAMEEDGYTPEFSVAVTAASACIGPIIPPSICAIVYASMSGLSVSSLFIGGVIPGIFIGLVQMALIVWYAKRDNFRKGEWRGFGYVGKTFVEALPALIMPLIILGGILSGVFSATEAGVVACVYGTIVGFAKRNLTLKSLPTVFINAATVAATTMIVIGFAQVLSWMLTRGQFANILGFFIDTTALLILAVPVVAPIIASIHIDPVHFANLGIIMCIMGACTPPVGVLLFICCGIAKIPVMKGAKALAPFLTAMVILIIILSFIPGAVTWLPSLIKR